MSGTNKTLNCNYNMISANSEHVLESIISMLVKLRFKKMFMTFDKRNMHEMFMNSINTELFYDY